MGNFISKCFTLIINLGQGHAYSRDRQTAVFVRSLQTGMYLSGYYLVIGTGMGTRE